jgi:hypothetical protein
MTEPYRAQRGAGVGAAVVVLGAAVAVALFVWGSSRSEQVPAHTLAPLGTPTTLQALEP